VFFSVGVYFWNGILYSWSEIPRLIILFSMILWIFWSICIRILLNIIQGYLLKKNKIPKRRLLLITNKSEKSMQPILQDIKASKIYNIIAYSNEKKRKNIKLSYLWGITEIEKLASSHLCDEILYIDSDFSKDNLYKIWELSKIYWIRYRYISNNFDVTKTNTSLSLINQTPVIEIQNTPLEHWGRIWKRFFDVILSLWILIFWMPFWCFIALLIKIEDPSGPIIYKNRRIGQHWKIFNCYKFRYLKWEHCIKESYWVKNKDDPAIKFEKELIENKSIRNWPLYKIKQDPRKTKIWNFLEKYSLDELPNFINVIKWEMSIVGPRPHQPREVNEYEQYQRRLLTIKPWITGMAQVNGRDENNFALEAKLDIFYIENWSFLLDLKIMLKTFVIILTRK
jgi:exopolysaccharide biosynthesis polyprenyl glycosylphosphotransferase